MSRGLKAENCGGYTIDINVGSLCGKTSYMNTSRRECSVERWRWRGLRRRDIVHIVLAVNGGHQKGLVLARLFEHEPI